MSPELKAHMKDAFLNQLASEEKLVRNSVANLIAGIASIEIPRKEWGDLLSNLSQSAYHDDYKIRLTALTSLGYICEEVAHDAIEQPRRDEIISALTTNMTDNKEEKAVELTNVSLRAFANCTSFVGINFARDNEREFIMT